MLSRRDLLSLMEELGIPFRLYEHEAVYTIAEAENLCRSLDGQLCKSLLLADTQGALYLLAARGSIRVDMKALALRLQSGRLSFAPPEALQHYLGCPPGAASLLGLVNDAQRRVTAVIEEPLLYAQGDLLFHPLENTASVAIRPEALGRFLAHTGHTPIPVADISR